MNIVYFANHNVGCRCLETLQAEGLPPGLVVVQKEEPEHLSYDSVELLAKKLGIATHVYDPQDKPGLVSRLRQYNPDVLISVAWRYIFPKAVLDIPKVAAINFHGSFLPRCRGAHPTNWAIISGENETGVSVHFLDPGVDTGDIILQDKFPILPSDTAHGVRQRQDRLSLELMRELARMLKQGKPLPRRPQDNSQATVFRKRGPDDGQIRWKEMTSTQVFNFVRALTEPYPGAYTFHAGQKIILWEVAPVEAPVSQVPGTVFKHDGHPCVACAEGYVRILRHGSQPEGPFPPVGSGLDG